MWRFGIILNPDGAYNLDIKHDKSAKTKPKTQLSITFIYNCKQVFLWKIYVNTNKCSMHRIKEKSLSFMKI